MSTISSVTNSTPATVSSSPGDNGSSAAGGVDFDDVLKQLYAIEDECDKAIGELTQKVEQLAKGAEATAGAPPSTSAVAPVASSITDESSFDVTTAGSDATSAPSTDLQPSLAGPDSSSVSSLANYMKATQSYTKAQVLPDLNAALLFATSS